MERLVVLWIRRNVGLRAGLLFPFCLEMPAQRGFALRIGALFELLWDVLQDLNVGRDAFGLDGTAGRREIARGRQPQCAVAGAKRDDGLYRSLAERAGADHG